MQDVKAVQFMVVIIARPLGAPVAGLGRHRKKSVEYIAQVNIGRIKAQLDDPVMAGFVTRLDEINALADRSPGFVWRFQTPEGNATYLRPYDDDRLLLNMSVWETLEDLKHYVYRTAHAELLRQRQEWFEKLATVYAALWWVPINHIPGVDEAKKRLAHLDAHGPTQFAFTFKAPFPPDEEFQRGIDWSSFQPCTAS
ncbi:MAG: DUF3291 domain-containing protein [Candidatus Sulfotelmatobacter sp.]|jgi:heme-degrading monooxygenase HmoA